MALRKHRITVGPGGALGDALNTNVKQWQLGRPGVVRFIQVNYVDGGLNAEMDLTMKRDSSTGGTIFSKANSSTDVGPKAVGTVASDEARNPTAATDALSGGLPFTSGLYVSIAQMDDAAYVDIDVWYDTCRKKTLTLVSDTNGDSAIQWTLGRPGVVRFVEADYSASGSAGTTLIKADTTAGATLFTDGSNATDFGPIAVGTAGFDEGEAAIAATDGVSGGLPFSNGLYVVRSGAGSTKTDIVSFWYDA